MHVYSSTSGYGERSSRSGEGVKLHCFKMSMIILNPGFSKRGPLTNNFGITHNLKKDAESQLHPLIHWIKSAF